MAGQGEGKIYQYLSRPIEELINGQRAESRFRNNESALNQTYGSGYVDCPNPEICIATCDILIIGSGYGGSIAAHVLSSTRSKADNRELRVVMLERGKEFVPGEFPESLGDLPGEVRYYRNDHDDNEEEFTGDADALFDFRINKDVSALVANGLGGGSLTNANVALRPDKSVFNSHKWPKQLRDPGVLRTHFDDVEKLLCVATPDKYWLPKKYTAFRTLANSISATAEPAPITVDLDKCTKCGNCVTGCNVGAKQTLPFTVLREAQKNGLEIYTGASVLTVQRCPDDQAWTARFRRTATEKNLLKREIFQIRAKVVILAAGTLGTTEILLRSKSNGSNALPCSDQIGKRFSTNGDFVAFGYAGASEVKPIGDYSSGTYSDPGPTITGTASASFFGSLKPSITLQDAAVPVGLKHIFGEIVTTASLAARYVNHRKPEWFKRCPEKDPLVVHPGAISHSQIILAMGHDSASGCIQLSNASSGDNAHAVIKWPKAFEDPVFESIDQKLTEAYAKRGFFLKDRDTMIEGGFDGGDYLPSPAWRPIPKQVAESIGGGLPDGKLLTVHPLGGCALADSADQGVINHLGQVFVGNKGEAVHPDLYVMDGSMFPGALGINPFLTISALAHRNSQELRTAIEKGNLSFDPKVSRLDIVPLPHTAYRTDADNPFAAKHLDNKHIKLRVYEQLAAYPAPLPELADEKKYREFIKKVNAPFIASKQRCPFDELYYYRVVLSIDVTMADLDAYLKNPDTYSLDGTVSLSLDPSGRIEISKYHPQQTDDFNSHALFITPIVKEHLREIASGTCKIGLLVRDDPKLFGKVSRFFSAAYAAVRKRKEDMSFPEFLRRTNELRLTATEHSYWRRFNYTCKFAKGLLVDAIGNFALDGGKLLAYKAENPWNALLKMDAILTARASSEIGPFYVDVNYLLKDGIPQIIESPHMPATLMGMARLGLFVLRALIRSHLWSFRAADYEDHKEAEPALPEAIKLQSGRPIKYEKFHIANDKLNYPPAADSQAHLGDPYIRLAMYELDNQQDINSKEHVLLIHGLAHGGAVFTTNTIDVPMAAYFVEQGYIVWVLDHRLSPALSWEPHRRPVTMDNLAEIDIPLAVDHVYQAAGKKPIHVFAHCIGAGAFAMSALKGCLHDKDKTINSPYGESKIGRATIHAVTPWLVPSSKNRANAKLAAFYKDALRFDDPSEAGFDPIPPLKGDKPDFWEVLIDRVASSIPWPTKEYTAHQRAHDKNSMSKAVCNRMTLWYGHEWNHANLSDKTLNQIASLVGFGNLEIFRQIYFCILRERLTDRQGNNVYLTVPNVEKYWSFPTMFIHGQDNQVFSPAGTHDSAWKLNKTIEEIGKFPKFGPYSRPRVWSCKVPRYGHMDLIFGRTAFQDIFPNIHHFFASELREYQGAFCSMHGKAEINPNPERGFHKSLPSTNPKTGPILYSPKSANKPNGVVSLQVWLEPTRFATSVPAHAERVIPDKGVTIYRNPEEISSEYKNGLFWNLESQMPKDSAELGFRILYEYPKVPEAGPPILDAPPLRWLNQFDKTNSYISFALGSCRYPGSPFEKEASDKLFDSIRSQAEKPEAQKKALDFALFLGDQIYSDATANVFDTTEVVERYWERYRDAFGSSHSPNMQKLLNYLPAYFALDDHEFGDGWFGNETIETDADPEKREQYRAARDAARSYQGMASYEKDKFKFWYEIDSYAYPFFVMDTRTERKIRWADTKPSEAVITCPTQSDQWAKLTDWLESKPSNLPKFIACGSPLAPPLMETIRNAESWRNDDGWLGFPGSLAKFVEFICERQIKNVIMLGGDLHLSAYASMTFHANGKSAHVHQIIASGLYSPLPFANVKPAELGHGNFTIPGSNHQIVFGEPKILTTSPSHFLRVEVSPTNGAYEIKIQAYGNHCKLGAPLVLTCPSGSVFSSLQFFERS